MEPSGSETKSSSDAYSSPDHVMDATAEQKRVEEALRASESRYRLLFENNVAAVICNTPDGRIIDCNKAAARILGYESLQEMLRLNMNDIHWEPEKPAELMARLQVDKTLAGIEWKIRHKTGRPVWVIVNLNLTVAEGSDEAIVQATLFDISERRRAQEALRQNEATLREAMLAAQMGIWEWSAATDSVTWDEGLYRIAGLDPRMADAASVAYAQVIAPESWERLRAAAGTAFATGNPFELDLELVRPNGSRRFLIVRGKPLRDADGLVTKLRGTVQDITERKRAEEELRRSQDEQQSVMSSIPDYLWSADLDGRGHVSYRYYSPVVEKITGRPAEYFMVGPERWFNTIHPDDRPRIQKAVETISTAQVPHLAEEYRIVLPDGNIRWVHDSVQVRREEGKIRVDGVVSDITERKRAEEALRASDQRYKDFIAHSTEGVWRVELDEPIPIDLPAEEAVERLLRHGYFAESNVAHARIRGFSSAEEVIGKRLGELNPQADERRTTYLELARGGFQSGSVEYWGIDKEGNFRLLLRTDIPIVQDGKLVRVWGITRDITDLRRAEEERERSFKQLRALAGRLQNIREEERKRVAREIHDQLGQALTAIKIDLASLLRDLPAGDKPPAKRTSAILKLVDESIRTVRRISTELRPGMLDDLGLVATLEWAGEDFQARTGTACRMDLPQNDIAVNPEQATAIFRIFQETLTNVARHANATAVDVRMVKNAGSLTLEVRDNGRGIPADKLSATKSLGILGMRERAMLLGGELTIKGTPGSGTIVKVRIPEAGNARWEPHHDPHPNRG